ncbi:MAG: tetratricopeptide repeat protein [Planctomycetes bacterium]|nr:tetratricopeptide repeat protein [Planctomycetota bacterium]MCW8135358.1 tetratricopeptide repeat protein [Planctomycetota bacterium]
MPQSPESELQSGAEQAYLFRHAVLRDAAYELQLPAERERLHALAFHAMEELHGGGAPVMPGQVRTPHATDAAAFELAMHAKAARIADRYREYLLRAAYVAQRKFRNHEALACWQELAALRTGADRVEVLRHATIVAHQIGDNALAEQLARESLQVALACGSRKLEGAALGSVANICRETGRLHEASQAYEAAVAIHREVGNDSALGVDLGNLGGLLTQQGRFDDAEAALGEALATHRRTGNRRGEGVVMSSLGALRYQMGDPVKATELMHQSLAIHRADGNLYNEGVVVGNLAAVHQLAGRLTEAEVLARQALAIHQRTGSRSSQGVALGNIATIMALGGRAAEAEPLFMEALEILREVGNRRFEAVFRCELALAMLALGRGAQARQTWRLGASALKAAGDFATLGQEREAMLKACAGLGVEALDEEMP